MEKLIILKEDIGTVTNPSCIFEKIKKINIDYEQENFIVFYLNTKNKIIGSEVLFKGGVDACLICPKTIFRKTLRKGASKIIISHNHPSEDLTPSPEDIEIYEVLKKGGNILQIKVLDFIVFNKKQFYSIDDEENK